MDKNLPLVSIVMINYNWLSYIKRTIESIINLKYKNFEFIIVDNWSTDWSIEYIKTFDNIKLIQSTKLKEKNFACNLWIKNSRWKYILLCDNDLLIIEEELIENLIKSYNKNNNTWIIWLSFVNEFENKTNWYWNYVWFYYTKEKKSINLEQLYKYDGRKICFPSWIWFFIKKSIWNKLWWYDNFLKFWWDDSDIWIKSYLFWYKNYLYSNSIQVHIWMAERQDNKKFSIKFRDMFFADLYTMTKNLTLKSLFVILPIYVLYYLIRSIKQSIFRFSFWPLFAFFLWYILYIKNIKYNLKMRKQIQKNRIVKNDVFIFNQNT